MSEPTAMEDALLYGTGVEHIDADGTRTRVNPRKFFIRNGDPILRELAEMAEADPRSNVALCHVAGVAENTLSHIRTGRHVPSITAVEALGEVLGYRLQWVKL